MPTVDIYPSKTVTTNGLWFNPEFVYNSDSQFARVDVNSKGIVFSLEANTFNVGRIIPNGSIINSVVAKVYIKASTIPASGWSASFDVYNNTTLVNNTIIDTLRTSILEYSANLTSSFTYNVLTNNPRIVVKTSTTNNKGYYTFYIDAIFISVTYTEPITAPQITIKSVTKSKISTNLECNTSLITFSCNQDIVEWEARADGVGVGTGDLVGKG